MRGTAVERRGPVADVAAESSRETGRGPVVFLHVGAPKTGTTFLQEVLWAHRGELADEGVLLPGKRPEHFHATLDVRELPLDPFPNAREGAWQRLVEESLAWDGPVIISHELFAGASEEQARRAVESLSPAEVHVVFTARDLARQLPAEWQEHVKHRVQAPMGHFMEQVVENGPLAQWFWTVQNPAGVLGRWGSTLPADRVHLLTVPPSGAEPGLLWQRFASLVGIDPDRYDQSVARSNVSLGSAEVELLRRVNQSLGDRMPHPGPYGRFVKEVLAHRILGGRADMVKFGLSPDLWPWLEERSGQLIDDIRALGCDVVGDLDELRPPQDAPKLPHPDEIEEAAVIDAAADSVADLLQRLRAQTQRAQRAERELRKWRRRPVQRALIDASERRPWLKRARIVYWNVVNAARRLNGSRG